ncbi:MAG: hypothetical protein WCB86_06015 [Candidatus Dormiibacterota bacterium]
MTVGGEGGVWTKVVRTGDVSTLNGVTAGAGAGRGGATARGFANTTGAITYGTPPGEPTVVGRLGPGGGGPDPSE